MSNQDWLCTSPRTHSCAHMPKPPGVEGPGQISGLLGGCLEEGSEKKSTLAQGFCAWAQSGSTFQKFPSLEGQEENEYCSLHHEFFFLQLILRLLRNLNHLWKNIVTYRAKQK